MCIRCHTKIVAEVSALLRGAGKNLLDNRTVSPADRSMIGSAYAASDIVLNLATETPFREQEARTLAGTLGLLLANRIKLELMTQGQVVDLLDRVKEFSLNPQRGARNEMERAAREHSATLENIMREVFPGAKVSEFPGGVLMELSLAELLRREPGHPHDPRETVERAGKVDQTAELDDLAQQDRERTDSPPEEPLPEGEDESVPVIEAYGIRDDKPYIVERLEDDYDPTDGQPYGGER